MEVLRELEGAPAGPRTRNCPSPDTGEGPARRALRRQVARLEGQVANVVCEAFPEALDLGPAPRMPSRVLAMGELEELRDHLVDQLGEARRQMAQLARSQEDARARLERMLLDPASFRGVRISQRELGEPGCGVWRVAPRLGIIGRMMGWWQVKISSGCPLAT